MNPVIVASLVVLLAVVGVVHSQAQGSTCYTGFDPMPLFSQPKQDGCAFCQKKVTGIAIVSFTTRSCVPIGSTCVTGGDTFCCTGYLCNSGSRTGATVTVFSVILMAVARSIACLF